MQVPKLVRRPFDNGDALVVIAALAVCIAAVQGFAGAGSGILTSDEPVHLERTQGLLAQGWYLPPSLLENGQPAATPGGTPSTPYVYGPAFSLIAHAANIAVGNESRGTVASSQSAWLVRHLVSLLIGLGTAAAAGLAVWALSESHRFALWAAAALLAFPIWLGMSFFNPKDVPAAGGYTLFTIGLVLALTRPPDTGVGMRRGFAVAALTAAGFYLGAGVRIAFWAPLLASATTFAVLAWARVRLGGFCRDRVGPAAVAIGLVLGVAAFALTYPQAASKPLELLSRSLSDSSGYPWPGLTLTAGRLLPESPPPWYLPVWVFASSPLLLLGLAVTGVAVAVGAIARSARPGGSRIRGLLRHRELAIVLVLQQALLLPVLAIIARSSMYSGLRQHLYVVPALAIFAGVGAHALWQRVGDASAGRRWPRRATALLLGAALVVPMAEQIFLFPYNYAYVNPVAGIRGINGEWESDFYLASAREALLRLPAGAPAYCSDGIAAAAAPDTEPVIYTCSQYPVYRTLVDEFRTASADPTQPDSDSIPVIIPKRGGNVVPNACSRQDDVTRWVRGEEVVMAYVVRCDSELLKGPNDVRTGR